MPSKINVRSPYYIRVSNASLDAAVLNLYIYTGVLTTNKGTVDYTVRKSILPNEDFIVFEIAELVRDYLELTFNGTYASETVWVEADIELFNSSNSTLGNSNSDYIAFDGYGYFQDGINPELSTGLLQSNKTIYRLNDTSFRVPVYAENVNSVSFLKNGQTIFTQSISSSTNTNAQVIYASPSTNIESYQERVVNDGGTLEQSSCFQSALDEIDILGVDTVYVDTDSGVEVIDVVTYDECYYNPVKLTFANKFGVLQDIYFFKKSVEELSVTKSNYQAAVVDRDALLYDKTRHANQSFHTQGKISRRLNTGFVNDDYAEVIDQILLSDQVWITDFINSDEVVRPVTLATTTNTHKKGENEKLINYTINVEMANNRINDIR